MMKRVLDEKTKRILSGMLPFSPNSFVVWTPVEFMDLPKEVQPSFNIRPFDKATIDLIRSDSLGNKFAVETARMALKYAVKGWVSLIDLGTEEEISFSVEAIDSFPESLVWVLYKKCNEMTFGLSEAEKESLELQQRSESGPLSKAAQSADSIQS